MATNTSKKILIVEDDASLSAPLSEKLSENGFNVLVAEDGQKGLELAEKEKPDLVLIDILLPKLDGISMAKQIKGLGLGISMMFLTNLNDAEHISDAITAEITDYLVKADWTMNDIVTRIKKKLEIK